MNLLWDQQRVPTVFVRGCGWLVGGGRGKEQLTLISGERQR